MNILRAYIDIAADTEIKGTRPSALGDFPQVRIGDNLSLYIGDAEAGERLIAAIRESMAAEAKA